MPSFAFDKYSSILGRPNGRPVGVRNGQGERPQGSQNPALDGMKHADMLEGMSKRILSEYPYDGHKYYNERTAREKPAIKKAPSSPLIQAQQGTMRKHEFARQYQTHPLNVAKILWEESRKYRGNKDGE